MTARIIGRIRIARITMVTIVTTIMITIIMTGTITIITVATIGIIIGGKTHVMVCKQGSGKPLPCSLFGEGGTAERGKRNIQHPTSNIEGPASQIVDRF